MKNFIKKHWWKPLFALWIIYLILGFSAKNVETNMLGVVVWAIVFFAAGYDFGKNHR